MGQSEYTSDAKAQYRRKRAVNNEAKGAALPLGTRKNGEASESYLRKLESQMKSLWQQYIKKLDQFGPNEEVRRLRSEYFQLYWIYRENKEWREYLG